MSNSDVTNDNSSSLFCFGNHLDYPEQQLEERFLMSPAGVYISYSLALMGNIAHPVT